MTHLLRQVVLYSALWLSSVVVAAEYHVSPSGDDNSSGLQGSPWRTIARANSSVQPGDTVYLYTGVYEDSIAPGASGQLGKPITYTAAPGEKPIIDKGERLNGGWKLVSGTDGVDAIYRKQGSHDAKGMVREDTLEENGRDTLYWNRGYQTTKEISTLWRIDRPAEYYHQDGYFYVRTTDSRSPDTHELIELNGEGMLLSGRSHIVIDGITIRNVHSHVNASNAHYITIQNCTLEYSKGYSGLKWSGSSRWIVRNNVIRGHGSVNAHKGDLFLVIGADYSLIENNQISYTAHLSMKIAGDSKYTVVRGNRFSEAYGKIVTTAGTSLHTLIERNDFTDAPTASALVLQHNSDHAALQIGGEHVIVRFNRFYSGSGGPTLSANDIPSHGELRNFVLAHNVIADNQGVTRNQGDGIGIYKEEVRSPLIINNIIADNRTSGGGGGQIGFTGGTLSGSVMSLMRPVIENNIIFSADRPNEVFQDNMSVSEFEQSWSAYAKNNLALDPGMHLPEFGYALKAGSPAIDAGRFITFAIGNGESRTVPVVDAHPFYDGFTIEQGDWIRIGGEPARITFADYANNVLTVDRVVAWQDGDGVSYDYSGLRPDLGAVEYTGDVVTTRPMPPAGLVVIVD